MTALDLLVGGGLVLLFAHWAAAARTAGREARRRGRGSPLDVLGVAASAAMAVAMLALLLVELGVLPRNGLGPALAAAGLLPAAALAWGAVGARRRRMLAARPLALYLALAAVAAAGSVLQATGAPGQSGTAWLGTVLVFLAIGAALVLRRRYGAMQRP